VESIFTFKELEKAPLQEVIPFKPPEEWKLNAFQSTEEEQKFHAAMHKIAEKVSFPCTNVSWIFIKYRLMYEISMYITTDA
jgi:hypothetical protein